MKVFISSTSQDLKDYRQAAIDVCNRLQIIPVGMEYFGAVDRSAVELCRDKVRDCDVYVGIIAHRYGHVPPDDNRSMTEIEFDTAAQHGLDRLCFLVDETYPWPVNAIEYDAKNKLNAFKSRIDSALVRETFTTVDNFESRLLYSLRNWLDAHNQPSTDVTPARDNRPVRSVPPLSYKMIGRDATLQTYRDRLITGGSSPQPRPGLQIIHGWPGMGKTTFVTALAYDDTIRTAFQDGILWASPGETARVENLLINWLEKLSHPVNDRSLPGLITALQTALADRDMLLIVDDIWTAEAGIPFKQAGANNTVLMTTRFPGVARQLINRPDQLFRLEQLNSTAAATLFADLAPNIWRSYPAESKTFIEDVEGLPLAIRVGGRVLESRLAMGVDVQPLFVELRETSALLNHLAPDDRFDAQTGTTPTIRLLLERSTDLLSPELRRYYGLLGKFAASPATFTLAAMQAVWQVADALPAVEQLVQQGLLEPIPQVGRFQIHAILALHAREIAAAHTPQSALSDETRSECDRLAKKLKRLIVGQRAGQPNQQRIKQIRSQLRDLGCLPDKPAMTAPAQRPLSREDLQRLDTLQQRRRQLKTRADAGQIHAVIELRQVEADIQQIENRRGDNS